MPHESLRIRRGRGLLANDNPASTSPGPAELQKAGKDHGKSRRIVGVFTLGICAITTA